MQEVWKDIQGYEGLYKVSNLGNVMSLKLNRIKILKGFDNFHGYKCVDLYKEGKRKPHKVHRLVAMCFINNPKNKSCVNHINGIKYDNNSSNLEWCDKKENAEHASEIGLIKSSKMVKQYSLDGCFIEIFRSLGHATKSLGKTSPGSIHACCSGRTKTAYGFKWEYAD